jgi:hypothetical protein
VLRAGGTVGTATWAQERDTSPAAYNVWDKTLTEGGAPPITAARVDTGLDSAEAIAELLGATGFTPTRVWIEALNHQWTPDTYFQHAEGLGLNRVRLDVLDEQARAETLNRARVRLSSLEPEDLLWSGDVVCAVATRTNAVAAGR